MKSIQLRTVVLISALALSIIGFPINTVLSDPGDNSGSGSSGSSGSGGDDDRDNSGSRSGGDGDRSSSARGWGEESVIRDRVRSSS